MRIPVLDLGIVGTYVVLSLLVGLYFSRRATQSVDHYFVGNRTFPWWLAGTSMIASSFSIDTPFGITGLVAAHGISGVWFAWSFAIGGAGTFGAFVFASMLRRSNIITTAELIELRYSGRGAAILRGFKGVYFGILSLSISMGWVIRSVVLISQEALGWDILPTLVLIILITIVYTTAAGYLGVAVTDVAQFIVGSIGSVALAYYAVKSVGGIEGLFSGLNLRFGAERAVEYLQFFPRPSSTFFHTFIVFVTLKWWGNPPASMTQRIMSTKDERHATFATMFFAAVHFAVNYWPMILAALVSLVSFPEIPIKNAERGYALLLMSVLPSGVLGITLSSLVAGFMSTIDTQANTGASFMVNDLYRRFIRRNSTDRHYVIVSQICTVIMLALAVVAAFFMTSVKAAWDYLALLIAGYGFVVVARWFWWRINAWSELAALLGSGIGSVLASKVLDLNTFGTRFIFVAVLSCLSWIVVALLTKPPSIESLARFCRRVKPYPAFWGPVRERYPDIEWSPNLLRNIGLWFVGLACVYCVCFGLGNFLIGVSAYGWGLFGVAAGCLIFLLKTWRP
ncbi:MAG: sodium:solute symporter family protein [Pseudomonadota bacterium]